MNTETTGRRLVVDRSACAGHGLCYGKAPSILDCDDQGDPVIMVHDLDAEQLSAADIVVRACPEHALHVELIDAGKV